jgi:hypothetical protein
LRENIDYRCEDGIFSVSASCVTTPNPNSLSSSETGVNSGIKKLKRAVIRMSSMPEPLMACNSQMSEELGLYNLVQNLTISNPGL